MELQYVLSGTGLALDADGGETPIGPGGAVISPAGPAGAHGFRNTGPLPLTLLCVYPAPGGATPGPDRVRPHDRRGPGPPDPLHPAGDGALGGARLPRCAGRPAPRRDRPGRRAVRGPRRHRRRHPAPPPPGHGAPVRAEWHRARPRRGRRRDTDRPRWRRHQPGRTGGAHGFRNTGSLPLQLLCVYPSPGGAPPGREPFVLGG